MALIKTYELPNGTTCEYHTPIIMQNGKKQTTVGISSFLDEDAYLAGKEPLRSRVDTISLLSKYPTAEEIYDMLKLSKLDDEGNETNFYADAEDDM